ncbi:MAG: leucine-rich repeat domain-containing protein [Flavobacteriales bacterium]|nr:leucine-rich repeat domain-containing protein [Flavobacteriales bacterium]
MKKSKLLSILTKYINLVSFGLLALIQVNVCAQGNAYIPDVNFRSFLNTTYPSFMDASGDSLITDSAATVTSTLACNSQNIADLSGAEHFTNITMLRCDNNQLTVLPDLANNIVLQTLNCGNNLLTALPDLTNNSALQVIYCYQNQLTALPDLSNNTALEWLYCHDNQLTSLPSLMNNNALERLGCATNLLTALPNFSDNTALEWIFCNDNQLTALPNLDNNTSLYWLNCNGNQLTSLPDLTNNTSLGLLYCKNNLLSTLPDLSNNNITQIFCQDNLITALPDLTNNTNLGWLYCFNNQLTALPDLTANTTLYQLHCYNNQLTSLPNLSTNTNLTELYCYDNLLTTLPDLSNNIALEWLNCSNNQLISMPDLSNNSALVWLYCQDNKLSSIPNLSNNSALGLIDCRNNKLDFSDARELRIADTLSGLFILWYSPQNPFGTTDTFDVALGDSITISIATQDSALSYQWFRGADTLVGETDTFLTIQSITPVHGGNYTCKSYGTALDYPSVISTSPGINEFVSEPFIVNVQIPTLIASIDYQTNVSCNGGSDGEASVNITGGFSPYTIEWSDNLSQITDTATGLIDSGYYVVITDSLGTIDTAYITITSPAVITVSQAYNVCYGGSIVVGSSVYDSSGVFIDVLTAIGGCDSTVTTNLTVASAITASQSFSICFGDSIIVNGNAYSSGGVYIDLLTTNDGCDSTLTTALTVNDLPVVSFTELDSSYCTTDSSTALIGSPIGGSFIGIGIIGNEFNPTIADTGSFIINYSYTDGNSCSNSASQDVLVVDCAVTGYFSSITNPVFHVYPNPTNAVLYITGDNNYEMVTMKNLIGDEVGTFNSNQEVNLSLLAPSIYFVEITFNNGQTMTKKIIKN